jgi:hypothetical protein
MEKRVTETGIEYVLTDVDRKIKFFINKLDNVIHIYEWIDTELEVITLSFDEFTLITKKLAESKKTVTV